jgi:hypothetical protein
MVDVGHLSLIRRLCRVSSEPGAGRGKRSCADPPVLIFLKTIDLTSSVKSAGVQNNDATVIHSHDAEITSPIEQLVPLIFLTVSTQVGEYWIVGAQV